MATNTADLYDHKDYPTETVITRRADKQRVRLTGQTELMFLREVAYLAGDTNLSFNLYALKVDKVRAKYFNENQGK